MLELARVAAWRPASHAGRVSWIQGRPLSQLLSPHPSSISRAETGTEDPIPLPNVSSPILAKIIEYCTYHGAAEAPDGSGKPSVPEDERRAWDDSYVRVEQSVLFELILAANYLNVKPLLDLLCLTVANMIKGKTPDEIRAQFHIENDFTPSEEEEVRRENQWAFE